MGSTATPNPSAALFVVATPIGNLADFSQRAQETLRTVDLIYSEDTRHFAILAKRFEIRTAVQSYHEHNERGRLSQAEVLFSEGKKIALVSDAGTPLISDPGYHIVNLAHELGVPVTAIPGPCAAIAALSASGFEPHRFIFEGFVPVKKQRRRRSFETSLQSGATVIWYESPHRIISSLELLAELAPQLQVCVARELTKVHEELLRGPVAEVLATLQKRASVKGEIVLLLRAAAKDLPRAVPDSNPQEIESEEDSSGDD